MSYAETAFMFMHSKQMLRQLMKKVPKDQSTRSAVLICTILNMSGVDIEGKYSLDTLRKLGKSAKKVKPGDVIVTDDLAYLVMDESTSLTISPALQPTISLEAIPEGTLRRIV